MATVDPDDDLRRFVVRRYAWDLLHRQRRHKVVAAFDNEAEFSSLVQQLSADLARRRAEGIPVDRAEHYGGVVLEPGHSRRARRQHLLRELVQHGVSPTPGVIEQLDHLTMTHRRFPEGSSGSV